jgi:hypothetical protein
MSNIEQTHRFGDPEPPRRSWFARNWGWVLIFVGAGGFCVCCGGFGGLLMLGTSVLKNSDAFTMALKRTQESPEVQEAIGQPIKDASVIPQGNIDIKNNTGDAHFEFDVEGPKGRAHVSTRATMENGKWTTTHLEVDVVNGGTIKLE